MATINHKTYNEATETFKDFNVYDGKETLIFKVDGSGGNVGIGTSLPFAPLDVNSGISSSSGTVIVLSQNTNGAIKGGASLGLSIQNSGEATNAADLWFRTANGGSLSERMRITSTGNVGIGTSNPQSTLSVSGTAEVSTSLTLYESSTGAGSKLFLKTIGSNYNFLIGRQYNVNNGFEITPSTTAGGSTFSTPAFVVAGGTGNVGIGTTSPSIKLDVESGVEGTTAGIAGATYGIRFDNGGTFSSGASTIHGVNSTLTVSYQPLRLNGSYTALCVNNNEIVRATANGLTFNGDTAAANALDDYEEGTWTPVLIAAGGGGQASYTTQLGTYTKIGRQVTATFHLVFTKGTLSGGTLQLTAFPFTAEANMYPEAALLFDNLAIDLSNPLIQKAASNSGSDFIADNGSTGTHSGLAVNTYLSAGTMTCRATVTYFV